MKLVADLVPPALALVAAVACVVAGVAACWFAADWVTAGLGVDAGAEWADRVDDRDTSGPWTPTGPPDEVDGDFPPGWECVRQDWGVRCTKPAPAVVDDPGDPAQLPSTDGTWGHGMPRQYRECAFDSECPESAPKCDAGLGRCRECAYESECQGATNHCRDGRCVVEDLGI